MAATRGDTDVTGTDWGVSDATDSALRLLHEATEKVPDQAFLDFDGTSFTYAEVWSRAAAIAQGLRSTGVAKGDTVVSMLDNNSDSVAAWFGANMIGAIWVGINTALRGEFLRHVLADSGARVALCEADFVDRFVAVEGGVGTLERLVVRGDEVPRNRAGGCAVESLAELCSGGGTAGPIEPTASDVSLLVYTSGTTGPSKGCVISHGYVVNLARRFLEQTDRCGDDLNWSPLPMYHFNLIGNTIAGTLMVQGTAAIAPRFSVSRFWPEIERTGARVVNLLGSMGALIAAMPDTPEMARCHGQIRVVHGAPFPAELQQTWRERFGVRRVGGGTYGLTEAVPLTTLRHGEPEAPGTSGRRNDRDFDVRIFDADDRELPPREVGEIVARPRRPNVMFDGYWKQPESTVAATRDLWLRTGDLGMFDDDGFLHFVDRKKDYLRRRGENISSQELEATYIGHPAIADVAVHAVTSELGEDDVKVTAVLADGSALAPEELFEWSKERVPYFALPRYIEFREALPTSAVGKVLKHRLRDEGCTPSTWDRERADVTWERR